MKKLIIALMLAAGVWGQGTTIPPVTPDTTAPVKYILDASVGFDRYASPRFSGGLGFAFPITSPTMSNDTMVHNTYLSVQYDATSKYTTTVAEIVRVLYRNSSQRLSLFSLVGAGGVSGGDSVGFAADGGGGVRYAPFKNTPEFGLLGAVRVKQVANQGTYFAPTFGVSFSLK